MIERDTDKRYQVDNLLMKVSETIKRFNALRCTPFKVLIAAHRGNASVLYHIDTDGRSNEIIEHTSMGSGSIIADKFCSGPERDRITMRDFAKYAFLVIHFMDHCPALGVGVEQGGVPNIKYLHYDQEWDKEPTKEDINEYREYTSTRLPKIIEGIDSILKQ